MAGSRSEFVDEAIRTYAVEHSAAADAVQRELQAVTLERTGGFSRMQIGDDQALLMEMIAAAMGTRRAVEVGTFTGYSALAVARGMGPEGRLLCCDISEEWTAIAREYWEKAGVADRIELRIGPALATLQGLPADPVFDLAFIDADKTGYVAYYEEIVTRMRPGGIIMADNTLQGGRVLHPGGEEEDTVAMRAFNERVAADPRVRALLIPIGDGLTFLQRQG